MTKLNENERKVLAALAGQTSTFEEWFFPFLFFERETGLDRKTVRRACRSLTRKGLAQFKAGLWTEDGEPAGSGYGITKLGFKAAEALT